MKPELNKSSTSEAHHSPDYNPISSDIGTPNPNLVDMGANGTEYAALQKEKIYDFNSVISNLDKVKTVVNKNRLEGLETNRRFSDPRS